MVDCSRLSPQGFIILSSGINLLSDRPVIEKLYFNKKAHEIKTKILISKGKYHSFENQTVLEQKICYQQSVYPVEK